MLTRDEKININPTYKSKQKDEYQKKKKMTKIISSENR